MRVKTSISNTLFIDDGTGVIKSYKDQFKWVEVNKTYLDDYNIQIKPIAGVNHYVLKDGNNKPKIYICVDMFRQRIRYVKAFPDNRKINFMFYIQDFINEPNIFDDGVNFKSDPYVAHMDKIKKQADYMDSQLSFS